MSKKKKHPKPSPQPPSGHVYAHERRCYPLERLFKKRLVQAISKRRVDDKTVFTLHKVWNPKYGIEKQNGGRWNITERAEIFKAIELAKKRKDVLLVEE